MKWIEVIGVRTTVGNRARVAAQLEDLVLSVRKGGSAASITILHRMNVASDLCVHLRHDSTIPDPTGSSLGLRLVAAMEAFGLVHHSIWSEIQGGKTS